MTYLLLKQYRGPIGFVPPDVRVSVAHSPWLVRILWLTNHRPGATELAQLVYYLQICLQKQQVYRNRKLIARGSGYGQSTIKHSTLFVSDHGVGRIVMADDCVSESFCQSSEGRGSSLCYGGLPRRISWIMDLQWEIILIVWGEFQVRMAYQ